jgi:hypothetical protein
MRQSYAFTALACARQETEHEMGAASASRGGAKA